MPVAVLVWDMDPRYRDGLSAVVALAALLAVGVTVAGWRVFVDPLALGVGFVGTLLLEAAFLRYPDRLLAVWERPGVAPGAAVAVLVAGAGAVWAAPWLLGALAWGLVGYLALLACVLAGVGNPVAVLVPSLTDRK